MNFEAMSALLFSVWVSWAFGMQVGRDFFHERDPGAQAILGYPTALMGGFVVAYFVLVPVIALSRGLNPFAKGEPGDARSRLWLALKHSPPGRFLHGLFWRSLVGLVVGFYYYGLPLAAFIGWQIWTRTLLPGWAWIGMAGVVAASIYARRWMTDVWKIRIGRRTQRLRYWRDTLGFGQGGSSDYGSIFDDWAEGWVEGHIRFGGSHFDRGFVVGGFDNRHHITIATTRAGKGRSAIIPNLIEWPGSVLCVDVKGQNAMVTAQRRRDMGQAVHIVDPFEVCRSMGVNDPLSSWNPLAEVDTEHVNAYEDVAAISEALIVASSKTQPFWDETARIIINGLIAHVLTDASVPDDARNLGRVFSHLSGVDGLPLEAMLNNRHRYLGDSASTAARLIEGFSEDTKRDLVGTARQHLNWLNSAGMKNTLASSSFSLRDLKAKQTTVYMVIPPNLIKTHNRFLRLFINMTCQSFVKQPAKGQDDCLMLLDEFYSLGRLDVLTEVMANIAGYGVRVWTIVHNIGQLEDLYGDNWETFLGQAGRWQVFALNDARTMNYLAERLGYHTHDARVFFRTAQEMAMDTSRASGQQIVFTEGARPLFLTRQNYDDPRIFDKSMYRADPYEARGVKTEQQPEIKPEEPSDIYMAPDYVTFAETPSERKYIDEFDNWTGGKNRRKGKIDDLKGVQQRKAIPHKKR